MHKEETDNPGCGSVRFLFVLPASSMYVQQYPFALWMSITYACCFSLARAFPIAFRLNTYCTHVFRRWLMEKALAKEKQHAYVMLIHKANGYC